MQSGYILSRIEMLNWGNFHGYQAMDLHQDSGNDFFGMGAKNSTILGINGSGKSTIIDGMMMCLLPFERHLKLGVTNDVEYGGSGGRSIHDYILGKFASGNIEEASRSLSYGRKDGCSIFLLQFRHQGRPNKVLTVGRIWWYSNGSVLDTQYGFISGQTVAISDLCSEKMAPKNAKDFREKIKKNLGDFQTFDSLKNYFQCLSSCFGNVSKDDLKILNRAFYVKSIEQIDHFIRETMLIENEAGSLQSLLDHVRTGKEIASSIAQCKKKIESMSGLMKDLQKLEQCHHDYQELGLEYQILEYYRNWIEVKKLEMKIFELQKKIQELDVQIPHWSQKLDFLKSEIANLQVLISQQDVEIRLQKIELELQHLQEKISWYEKDNLEYHQQCQFVGLKAVSDAAKWSDFQEACAVKEKDFKKLIQKNQENIEVLRSEKFTVEAESSRVKSEMNHIAQSGCLIPEDIYQVKIQACKDLKIPEKDLRFVGELIQVSSEHRSLRRAIESVLFPISRNLLCAPSYRDALTKWLDQQGLRSDITVKRISEAEMSFEVEAGDFSEEDILGKIEVLDTRKHPFSSYLWNWLLSTFDYKLVDVSKFKNAADKVVTIDGLVKTDSRTMRKLKKSFSYSLGWDNADLLADLGSELQRFHQKHQDLNLKIQQQSQELENLEAKNRIISVLQKKTCEFLTLNQLRQEIDVLKKEQKHLLSSHPDYQKMKQNLLDFQKEHAIALEQYHGKVIRRKDYEDDLIKGRNALPAMTQQLESGLDHHSLCQRFHGIETLQIRLEKLDEEIQGENIVRQKKVDQIKSQMEQMNKNRNGLVGRLSSLFTSFEKEFNDPNLPYRVGDLENLEDFIQSWSAALERLEQTELPQSEEKWRQFFEETLIQSVRDTVDEIKRSKNDIVQSMESINNVLQLTNYEDLPTEKRYLKIHFQNSQDDRIRKFCLRMGDVEKVLGAGLRSLKQDQSQQVMEVLLAFVEDLQNDTNYREFVMDVRHHYQFRVYSYRRVESGPDQLVEIFEGARKDAKSSAQTTHLAYTLLASSLSYRFHFNDPIRGENTLRLIILDEFGGKFDNEKPKDIVALLDKMGFQAVLVSPMSKAELLADRMNQLVLVYKNSVSHSKVQSYGISSKEDYLQRIGKLDPTVMDSNL